KDASDAAVQEMRQSVDRAMIESRGVALISEEAKRTSIAAALQAERVSTEAKELTNDILARAQAALGVVENTSVGIRTDLAEWAKKAQERIEQAENTAREAKEAADNSVITSQEAIARADAMVSAARQAADEAMRASQAVMEASKRAAQEASEFWMRAFGEIMGGTGDKNLLSQYMAQKMASQFAATTTADAAFALQNKAGKPSVELNTSAQPQESLLNSEKQALAEDFKKSIRVAEPPISDKQAAKRAQQRMQQRMDSLSRMFISAENGASDNSEVDDDHVIEED
ncbi:MAG: hypothetical protein FWE97_04335, partial [Dehalococcoidia bacterium]|nr:hypothetical protein [Dehalococcoidia bacterium]